MPRNVRVIAGFNRPRARQGSEIEVIKPTLTEFAPENSTLFGDSKALKSHVKSRTNNPKADMYIASSDSVLKKRKAPIKELAIHDSFLYFPKKRISKSAVVRSSKGLSNQDPEDLNLKSSLGSSGCESPAYGRPETVSAKKDNVELDFIDFWPDEKLSSINESLKTVPDRRIRVACINALFGKNFAEFKRLTSLYPALISMPIFADANNRTFSMLHPLTSYSEISEFVIERISPLLIDYPDGTGNTPLYYAVLNENVKSLKALIGAGANADQIASNKPLLQLAIGKSLFKSAEVLLQHANTNSPVYQNYNVIFHLLVIQNFSLLQVALNSSELISLEIFYSAFKKLIAYNNFTPEIVTEVIKSLASHDRYQIVLNNLLDVAFIYGRVDMLKTFHELGYDLDREFSFRSAVLRSVHVAAYINSQPIFDYLLSKNISSTTLDSLGRSVLDIALSMGHFDFAQHILDCNVLLSLNTSLDTVLAQIPEPLFINLIVKFPSINFITFPDGSNVITKCMKLSRSDLLNYLLNARVPNASIRDTNGESIFSYSFVVDASTKTVIDNFIEAKYMFSCLDNLF